jgi:hypothetical protein
MVPLPKLPPSWIYHRVRPTHRDSAVRWLLYDGFMDGHTPHTNWAAQIPALWISRIRDALRRVNPFVRALQFLHDNIPRFPLAALTLQDSGSTPEIAAVMSYDNTTTSQIKPRRLIISRHNQSIQQIATVSRMWEPLAYPLLFPHGTLGWGVRDGEHVDEDEEVQAGTAPTTQMWHYRSRVLRDDRFKIFGRLTNEYLVDMFTRDLETRLNYIRRNQIHVCTRSYNHRYNVLTYCSRYVSKMYWPQDVRK